MSEQEKPTNTQSVAKMAGPFSPDRYTEKDALAVGLPSPEGLNLLVKFSEQMVGTPFIPKGLAAGPNQAGNILAVIMSGREEGFSPMEALRSYWISPDGRLAKYADAVMAKMRRAGFKFPEQEFTSTRAHLKAIRPDGDEFTSTLTIEEVPGSLKGKQIWKDWPQRMLKARVIGDVYRFLASDLGGPTYTAEELQDLDYTPADTAESDRKRAEVIAARDDMKVSLKPKKDKSAKAEVVEIKTEKPAEKCPACGSDQPHVCQVLGHTYPIQKGPDAAEPEPLAEILDEAQPDPPAKTAVKYAIHRVFLTGGNKERVLPTEEEPHLHEDSANLRAQALANENNASFIVVEISDAGEPQEKRRFDPPKPAKPPEKAAEKPVTASAPPKDTQSTPDIRDEAVLDPRKALIDRLNPLAATLGLNGKTAMARFRAFFSGYMGLGLSGLPKEPSAYTVAIEELEGCIGGDPLEFTSGPEEAGKRRASWARETRGNLEALWPNDSMNVALGVALARRWRLSPQNFSNWMGQKVIGLTTMSPEDAGAYMRLMLATPVSRDGGKLLTCCRKAGVSIAKAVDQIESRALKGALESADEKTIQNAIDAWIANVNEYVGDPADTAQEPPPEEEGGLFDDLV